MKSNEDRTLSQEDRQNVVQFRPRGPQSRAVQPYLPGSSRPAIEGSYPSHAQPEERSEMRRYPVDIRGNVTFGRLMQGLATVGLTVRLDPRTGHVIIADYPE
jgi:hypothetical protein